MQHLLAVPSSSSEKPARLTTFSWPFAAQVSSGKYKLVSTSLIKYRLNRMGSVIHAWKIHARSQRLTLIQVLLYLQSQGMLRGQHVKATDEESGWLGVTGSRGKLLAFRPCEIRFPELSFISSKVHHRWWVCTSQGRYKLWPLASLRLPGNSAALLIHAKGNWS